MKKLLLTTVCILSLCLNPQTIRSQGTDKILENWDFLYELVEPIGKVTGQTFSMLEATKTVGITVDFQIDTIQGIKIEGVRGKIHYNKPYLILIFSGNPIIDQKQLIINEFLNQDHFSNRIHESLLERIQKGWEWTKGTEYGFKLEDIAGQYYWCFQPNDVVWQDVNGFHIRDNYGWVKTPELFNENPIIGITSEGKKLYAPSGLCKIELYLGSNQNKIWMERYGLILYKKGYAALIKGSAFLYSPQKILVSNASRMPIGILEIDTTGFGFCQTEKGELYIFYKYPLFDENNFYSIEEVNDIFSNHINIHQLVNQKLGINEYLPRESNIKLLHKYFNELLIMPKLYTYFNLDSLELNPYIKSLIQKSIQFADKDSLPIDELYTLNFNLFHAENSIINDRTPSKFLKKSPSIFKKVQIEKYKLDGITGNANVTNYSDFMDFGFQFFGKINNKQNQYIVDKIIPIIQNHKMGIKNEDGLFREGTIQFLKKIKGKLSATACLQIYNVKGHGIIYDIMADKFYLFNLNGEDSLIDCQISDLTENKFNIPEKEKEHIMAFMNTWKEN